MQGLESPRKNVVVSETWRGIKRTRGVAPLRVAKPLLPTHLRKLTAGASDNPLRDARDHALVLLGFAAALRRSELVALDVEDVAEVESGLIVTIRRSKGDPEGRGVQLGVPFGSNPDTCPVLAVRAWLRKSGLTTGPLFVGFRKKQLSHRRLWGRSVARIIQRNAREAQLMLEPVSPHGLRAGFVTAAAIAGKSSLSIAKITRHKSHQILARYFRPAEAFVDNAGQGIGL